MLVKLQASFRLVISVGSRAHLRRGPGISAASAFRSFTAPGAGRPTIPPPPARTRPPHQVPSTVTATVTCCGPISDRVLPLSLPVPCHYCRATCRAGGGPESPRCGGPAHAGFPGRFAWDSGSWWSESGPSSLLQVPPPGPFSRLLDPSTGTREQQQRRPGAK
jgi:hypothetical protein